jgi:hypothetical protein
MKWLQKIVAQCRRNQRRGRQPQGVSQKVVSRRIRIFKAQLRRKAQEEILRSGPPKAPWQRFPEIPNSVSIGWRMGEGEGYLDFTFYPWWQSLTESQRLEYLDATEAPDDWRERLTGWEEKRRLRTEAAQSTRDAT